MALATVSRSPNSWDNSLTYGVSPQPAQAPENSNRGSSSCEPLIVATSTRARSISGNVWKNSHSRSERSSSPSLATMSSDLWPACVFDSTGQMIEQILQPVQSEGDTARVIA